MTSKSVRAIAFYLPQFHPIPENDAWWGKGFTEWTNVAKARPLFRGHYQPHLPADLGFYDLRLPEAREAQAELAREHGISGFCYFHYWFNGKRLLERPFDEVLASGKPDFPFCLCWANETWSRRWLGEDKEILIQQTYSVEDFRNHARWLARAFADERYIRVNGRPVFVIYRYSGIPKEIPAIAILREELNKQGSDDPYLIAVDAHNPNLDYEGIGFDHRLVFEPNLGVLPLGLDDRPSLKRARRNFRWGSMSTLHKLYDYTEAVDAMEKTYGRSPPDSLRAGFVGQLPASRRERYHFPKLQSTVIRESSGAAIAKLGADFTINGFVFSQRLERVGGRQPPGARPEVRAWLSGRITPRPQSGGC